MRIEMQSRGIDLTPRLRAYIERRVRFAFSRHTSGVRSVQVRLADLNGPRGGVDQRCQIEVGMKYGDSIVVEVQDCLVEVAIGRASRRAARVLKERQSRRLRLERRPPRGESNASRLASVMEPEEADEGDSTEIGEELVRS